MGMNKKHCTVLGYFYHDYDGLAIDCFGRVPVRRNCRLGVSGAVTVPAQVTNNSILYSLTRMGNNAFNNGATNINFTYKNDFSFAIWVENVNP